ncbi:hypothetical protein Thimo_2904 [Thioflavicoccus mobilis 8321]|uniref:Uncharacterized protein n=1 Tax=Thioflavicoccus mobilis 8321 TaxID=765912 RepID=L0H1T0_9GAMM|nr:hypothetical protein [Thioflavicoccus mobilis]AGA91600.1 hypothetical protein Thimo_2904 [Thioflavicoccus mobilis 8321]
MSNYCHPGRAGGGGSLANNQDLPRLIQVKMLMKTRWFTVEGVLHLLVAIGAYPGGLAMMISPDGSLMGVEGIVDKIPFDSLLVPGVVLFTVNGVGQTVAGILSLRKHRLSPYISAVLGLGLMLWIIVESLMLKHVVFLSFVYFGIGALQTSIAAYLYFLTTRP